MSAPVCVVKNDQATKIQSLMQDSNFAAWAIKPITDASVPERLSLSYPSPVQDPAASAQPLDQGLFLQQTPEATKHNGAYQCAETQPGLPQHLATLVEQYLASPVFHSCDLLKKDAHFTLPVNDQEVKS